MSVLPASYIVEQAHLQCSVYSVCPMLDVTQTSCLSTVSMELSTPRVCTSLVILKVMSYKYRNYHRNASDSI